MAFLGMDLVVEETQRLVVEVQNHFLPVVVVVA